MVIRAPFVFTGKRSSTQGSLTEGRDRRDMRLLLESTDNQVNRQEQISKPINKQDAFRNNCSLFLNKMPTVLTSIWYCFGSLFFLSKLHQAKCEKHSISIKKKLVDSR